MMDKNNRQKAKGTRHKAACLSLTAWAQAFLKKVNSSPQVSGREGELIKATTWPSEKVAPLEYAQQGKRQKALYLSFLALLALLLSACDDAQETPGFTVGSASLEQNEEIPNALQSLTYHEVEVPEGHKSFHVLNRTEKITQYACSSCHGDELPPRAEGENRHAFMHSDIPLNHAASHVMDCRQCHNEKDMDTLRLNDGSSVSFNHSYKLCTQCHFQQGKDWAGGAHGKRMHAWRGKRVIMNCTECHDPHSPKFEQRFPKGRPTIPRTGGSGH